MAFTLLYLCVYCKTEGNIGIVLGLADYAASFTVCIKNV